MHWQRDLISIPAPPFGESARAQWLAERFREFKLVNVEIDEEGNVLGWARGAASGAEPCTVLSAHIDTVFPADVGHCPVIEDYRLTGPGACDNGTGVAGMMAVAAAINACQVPLPRDLLFVGNVGEEGEGNLRGVRHLYRSRWRERIACHVVLDGGGSSLAVSQALGSRRYSVSITGPGGHSWADAGTPNPVVALSRSIAALSEIPLPEQPRTTWNAGTIEGGSSVNAIPEFARARFDFRSLEADQLIRLEVALHRAVEDAVTAANQTWRNKERDSVRKGIAFRIERIGDRPAGRLPADAPLLQSLKAVDRHLGIQTEERVASTDANLPISLGIEALAMGAGGKGGGIHTRGEWYDARGRDLALKRILLLLIAIG